MAEALSGMLNLYKPVGMTSFQVIAKLRRLTGIRRIGHCGTLDPFAEGVLPVALNRATAAIQYMEGYDKAYQATLRLGEQTDTGDCEGTVCAVSPLSPKQWAQLEALDENGQAFWQAQLAQTVGAQNQIPPMYSAIKYQGRRLYDLARQGIEIPRKPRPIKVYSAKPIQGLKPCENDPSRAEMIVDWRVSKGTYIRTLAETYAQRLGTQAHLIRLVRTACGPYTVDTTVTLDQLSQAGAEWHTALRPIEEALEAFEALELTPQQGRFLLTGKPVAVQTINAWQNPHFEPDLKPYRIFVGNLFLGLATWRPEAACLRAERMMIAHDDPRLPA